MPRLEPLPWYARAVDNAEDEDGRRGRAAECRERLRMKWVRHDDYRPNGPFGDEGVALCAHLTRRPWELAGRAWPAPTPHPSLPICPDRPG